MTAYFESLRAWMSPAPSPAVPPHLYRVLVVDDEAPVRDFVARVVRAEGFEIETAADGVEALELATAKPFDLVLTDVMMPNMTGDKLGQALRAAKPDLPVLYLTGFSDRLFASRMVLGDGEAFLDKPCTVRGLREAVWLAATGRVARPTADLATSSR